MKSLTVTTANLAAKGRKGWRPKVKRYMPTLRRMTRPGVIARQEVGSGRRSVRVTPVGKRVKYGRQRFRMIGKIGVHRWVAIRPVRIRGKRVLVISAHGLHRKSVGRKAQNAYFRALYRWLRRLTKRGVLWILAGDFNRAVWRVARRTGAAGYVAAGIDGIVVSPGLKVRRRRVSRVGMRAGWTDHPSVTGVVTLAGGS